MPYGVNKADSGFSPVTYPPYISHFPFSPKGKMRLKFFYLPPPLIACKAQKRFGAGECCYDFRDGIYKKTPLGVPVLFLLVRKS